MRVLWFADAQLPEVTGAPITGGGWIEGLRRALQEHAPEIELGIASPGPIAHEPFSAGGTTYFHVTHPVARGRAARVALRWRHDPVPDGALARCVEIDRVFRPDVVHVHGSEHYFGLVAPLIAPPCVISLQGIATVLERYGFAGLRWTEVLKEVPTRTFLRGDGPIHGFESLRARAAVEQRIIAACDDFMGRTDWDRAVLRTLRPQARYHEVGEVLGEPFHQARWSGPRHEEGAIYCTGGSSPLKGVECLLQALILVRRAGAHSPRLRLAGGVVDGLLGNRIDRLLKAPELQGAVDILGRCSPAQIADELARATVFVLPSHMDNSPNSLCEAMLVGTPTIAAFVGGVPSLVKDGVEGLLYHDSDPFALAGKIHQLLGDTELAARLGSNARDTARRRHDPQTVAGQAVAAYREVLEQWRERHPERGEAGTRKGAS